MKSLYEEAEDVLEFARYLFLFFTVGIWGIPFLLWRWWNQGRWDTGE